MICMVINAKRNINESKGQQKDIEPTDIGLKVAENSCITKV